MNNILITALCVIGFLCLVFLVNLLGDFLDFASEIILKKIKVQSPSLPPSLGYKVAAEALFHNPDKNTHEVDLSLKGVMGASYGADEHHPIKKFHAYSSPARAFVHPQAHRVALEVLAYGRVRELELGTISTGQRVLQLILLQCQACHDQASCYVQGPSITHGFARPKGFYCADHAEAFVSQWKQQKLRKTDYTFLPPEELMGHLWTDRRTQAKFAVVPESYFHRKEKISFGGKTKVVSIEGFKPTVLPESNKQESFQELEKAA